MRGRRYYYDLRYLCFPAGALLRSYLADEKKTVSSSFFMIVMELVFFLAILTAFLLASFRIQLFRNSAATMVHGRGVELRFGRSALSVPVTLALATTLFLPPSSFWPAYLVILLMSPLSDRIHSLLTRYSYEEERLLLLPVLVSDTLPPPLLPGAQPGIYMSAMN
ncbi:hypothetical protein V2J09_006888 [Rumex salicifolius]